MNPIELLQGREAALDDVEDQIAKSEPRLSPHLEAALKLSAREALGIGFDKGVKWAMEHAGLKCFRCGDGHTPLYCLNCANELNKKHQPTTN